METTKRLWGLVALEALAIVVLLAMVAVPAIRDGKGGAASGTGAAAAGGAGGAANSAADKAVARIDGHTFTMGELQSELDKRYGPMLLNQLLDRQAILLEGKALGIGVPPEDIDKELKRMQQGYDSEAQFYDSMKEQLGMTRDQIREDTLYKLLLERIATSNVQIGDDQVDAYIRTHPEEFGRGVELHLAQIISASKELADKAYAELAKGTDFAIVARDQSIDDATANGGGDLGWVEEDDPFVPAPIMKAAQSLRPGSYSQPVDIGGGRYAIVQLKDRREKKGADPQTIREQVRKQLALSAAPPLQELVKQLRIKYHAAILAPELQP
jgi:foldase protein PrsA